MRWAEGAQAHLINGDALLWVLLQHAGRQVAGVRGDHAVRGGEQREGGGQARMQYSDNSALRPQAKHVSFIAGVCSGEGDFRQGVYLLTEDVLSITAEKV
jgi:hypothetical protein